MERKSSEEIDKTGRRIIYYYAGLLTWFCLLHHVRSFCKDKDNDLEYIKNNCGITQIPSDIGKEATDVDLKFNNIDTLENGAFIHLTHCIKIELSFNKLTHVASGMFDGLESLKYLFLDSNSLVEIGMESFIHLKQCRELNINNNKLSNLQSGMFYGLHSLKGLSLQHNSINDIEAKSFSSLTNCTHLYLDHNKLTYIQSALFDGLKELQELYLSSNKITNIEAGSFSHLRNCIKLSLSDNELTVLQSGIFEGLQSLKKLELYSNDITFIEPGSFWHLQKCVELYLSSNKLTLLHLGIFKGLESLNLLWLSNNSIHEIESDTFLGLSHCVKLQLNNNKLPRLQSGMFNGLVSLRELKLNNNSISDIQPGTFVNLIGLQTLFLKNNNLTTLKENTFQLSILTELTLSMSGNSFQCDSKLCWMIEAEGNGKIRWYKTSPTKPEEKPLCVNYPSGKWEDDAFNCKDLDDVPLNQPKSQDSATLRKQNVPIRNQESHGTQNAWILGLFSIVSVTMIFAAGIYYKKYGIKKQNEPRENKASQSGEDIPLKESVSNRTNEVQGQSIPAVQATSENDSELRQRQRHPTPDEISSFGYPTDALLMRISDKITNEEKLLELGSHLEMKKITVINVLSRYNRNATSAAFYVLLKWRNSQSSKDKAKHILAEALYRMNENILEDFK